MTDTNPQNPLTILSPVFAQISTGNFATDVTIPQEEDQYTGLYVGVQMMLDVIREKITSLEAVNRELETGIEEKNALLQSIGDGVVVVNTTGTITFINASAAALVRKSSSAVVNQNWATVLHFQDAMGERITYLSNLTSSTNKNESAGSTLTFVHEDGSSFPAGITVTPVIRKYELVGTIIVLRDITKEKKLESLKNEFLALATHQLRSPLATIRWSLEKVLKEPNIPQPVIDRLQTIAHHNIHMIDLVNDILNVSRLNDLTFSEQKTPQKITTLLESCLQQLKPEAEEKNITFSVSIEENPKIHEEHHVDATLLKHCFHNIISNAIKYSHQAGVVSISLHLKDDLLCLSVTDTGMGISETDQQHLFEKFHRGQNAIDKDIPGTGLGLYIVKSLMERWGGTVSCTSKESVGTTLDLCIPTHTSATK